MLQSVVNSADGLTVRHPHWREDHGERSMIRERIILRPHPLFCLWREQRGIFNIEADGKSLSAAAALACCLLSQFGSIFVPDAALDKKKTLVSGV